MGRAIRWSAVDFADRAFSVSQFPSGNYEAARIEMKISLFSRPTGESLSESRRPMDGKLVNVHQLTSRRRKSARHASISRGANDSNIAFASGSRSGGS